MKHCCSTRQFTAIWIPSITGEAAERQVPDSRGTLRPHGLGGSSFTLIPFCFAPFPLFPLLTLFCSLCCSWKDSPGKDGGAPSSWGLGGCGNFLTSCVLQSSRRVILHVLVLSFRALKVSQRFHYPKSLSVSRRELFR